jgi:hypothetical protein
MELSLDVLQRYEVRRLPSADPAKDLDKVRAYCQENRIDQAILGSGSARPGGGYRFRLVVYDRKTDSTTTDQQGASSGVLDMFDVTDALVASLLDGLSGTHLLFGSLSVKTDPAGAMVSVNGKDVGRAPLGLRGLPVGTVELAARMDGREGAEATVTIVDGETTSASLKLPTDLFKLVRNGTLQVVQAAISEGANVNAQHQGGETPLMAAAGNPDVEVITALLQAGAQINAKDKNGKTALMYAAQINQNPVVIMSLLEAGADAKAKNGVGWTAFDYAENNPNLKNTTAYIPGLGVCRVNSTVWKTIGTEC